MNTPQELLEKALSDLDLFNAAILIMLIHKKVCTQKEFEDLKKEIEPIVKERGEKAKADMKKAMEEANPFGSIFKNIKKDQSSTQEKG